MAEPNKLRIALIGNTGVGKGTFVELAKSLLPHKSIDCLKLAAPLYDIQDYIYKTCQVKKDYYAQDGALLNFLGQHLRAINPNVLRDGFKQRLDKASADIIICDDARALDVEFMTQFGFTMVQIIADDAIAFKRRKLRGDISLASSKHVTEQGSSKLSYAHTIKNEGTLLDYQAKIKDLLDQLL